MSTDHVKPTEVLCYYVSLKPLNVNQSTEEKDSTIMASKRILTVHSVAPACC